MIDSRIRRANFTAARERKARMPKDLSVSAYIDFKRPPYYLTYKQNERNKND